MMLGPQTKCSEKGHLSGEPWSISVRGKDKDLTEATWNDLEIIILSEISQKEKDKYHMISLCGILKNDKNKLICKIGTDTQT